MYGNSTGLAITGYPASRTDSRTGRVFCSPQERYQCGVADLNIANPQPTVTGPVSR